MIRTPRYECIEFEVPSSPYNPLLANAFFLSGYIESWGRGIEKIAQECEAGEISISPE